MKTCIKCNTLKDENEFRSFIDRGIQRKRGECKNCESEGYKKWKKENRQRINDAKKSWRKINRERCISTERSYREKNREKIAENKRRWSNNNPEKVKEYARNSWARSTPLNKSLKRATKAKWIEKNTEAVKKIKQRHKVKSRETLSDSYIKELLLQEGFANEIIQNTPSLIELKRLKVAKKRLDKTIKSIKNEKSKS